MENRVIRPILFIVEIITSISRILKFWFLVLTRKCLWFLFDSLMV